MKTTVAVVNSQGADFSLEEVECLASCGTAPVLQVNNTEYHENLTVARALELIERLASP